MAYKQINLTRNSPSQELKNSFQSSDAEIREELKALIIYAGKYDGVMKETLNKRIEKLMSELNN